MFPRAICSMSTDVCRTNGGEQFDSEGTFATAEAKTYQACFCGAVACAIGHAAVSSQCSVFESEHQFRHMRGQTLNFADHYEVTVQSSQTSFLVSCQKLIAANPRFPSFSHGMKIKITLEAPTSTQRPSTEENELPIVVLALSQL